MSEDKVQFNLRTIFFSVTIAASLIALFTLQYKSKRFEHLAFRLQHERVQLEQALVARFGQGDLNCPPELDSAEQLVYVLGGIDGEPMYFEFSDDLLVDVDSDRHPEYVAWDPNIPFVLNDGEITWMNRANGDTLEIREVVELLPKKPPAVYTILALMTLIACVTMLLWQTVFLEPFYILLIVCLFLWAVVGSGVH